MNKIKRGVSLLLCSLLFGSAVTLGNVADVHPVHNAVEYIDELGQHRGNGQFEHQFSNGISAQIVGL